MFHRVNMIHVKLYSDSVYNHPDYDRSVSNVSNVSQQVTSTKVTWKCPDCGGNHTTTANRKYYCSLLTS